MQLSKHVTLTKSICRDVFLCFMVTGVTLVVTVKPLYIDILYSIVTTVTTNITSPMKGENIFSDILHTNLVVTVVTLRQTIKHRLDLCYPEVVTEW